jgi:hypothetical protein
VEAGCAQGSDGYWDCDFGACYELQRVTALAG